MSRWDDPDLMKVDLDEAARLARHGRRYGQCDETCTVDCGHCKGRRSGPFSEVRVMHDPNGRPVTEQEWSAYRGWLREAPRAPYPPSPRGPRIDWLAWLCVVGLAAFLVLIVIQATNR